MPVFNHNFKFNENILRLFLAMICHHTGSVISSVCVNTACIFCCSLTSSAWRWQRTRRSRSHGSRSLRNRWVTWSVTDMLKKLNFRTKTPKPYVKDLPQSILWSCWHQHSCVDYPVPKIQLKICATSFSHQLSSQQLLPPCYY